MRRPLSIMRTDPIQGWVDFLYKAVGKGTRLLSERKPGEFINVLGPIGRPFEPYPDRKLALLLGGGVGIPPMVFLAEHMKTVGGFKPLVLMGSEIPFPFSMQPSKYLLPRMPQGVIAAMPLMEDWGIPSRLASLQDYPGCYRGYITELARHWLNGLHQDELNQVMMFACGPHPMLEACAALAREYSLPCEVSLEEYMACAVGGCAGCAVQVVTASGTAMKRVCVDGPVFPAESVFTLPR
jgi:dihydroorotate dehydrogenase electron transfer subunit